MAMLPQNLKKFFMKKNDSHGAAPGADAVNAAGGENPMTTKRVANNSRNGRSTDALTATCTRARGTFNKQLAKFQNIGTKRECLIVAANALYRDPIRCYADLLTKSEQLLDSMRFRRECKAAGLEPKIVAQHIVFEGATIFKKVREKGVSEVLGTRVHLFNEPLITVNMLPNLKEATELEDSSEQPATSVA